MEQIPHIAKDIVFSLFNDYLVARYSANSHQERTEKSTCKIVSFLNSIKSYYFCKLLKLTLKMILFHLQKKSQTLKNCSSTLSGKKKTCKRWLVKILHKTLHFLPKVPPLNTKLLQCIGCWFVAKHGKKTQNFFILASKLLRNLRQKSFSVIFKMLNLFLEIQTEFNIMPGYSEEITV